MANKIGAIITGATRERAVGALGRSLADLALQGKPVVFLDAAIRQHADGYKVTARYVYLHCGDAGVGECALVPTDIPWFSQFMRTRQEAIPDDDGEHVMSVEYMAFDNGMEFDLLYEFGANTVGVRTK